MQRVLTEWHTPGPRLRTPCLAAATCALYAPSWAFGDFLVVVVKLSGWCKWGSDRERVVRGEYSAADHNALLVTDWSDLRWSCLDGNEDDVKPPLERPMWVCLYYREGPHKARLLLNDAFSVARQL